VDVERLLQLAVDIQAIPAPTFQEAERAEFMRLAFERIPLDLVEVDLAGNVHGRLGQPGQGLLLVSAHLDSVFPLGTDLTVRREKRRLYGPGIGDNALGLAALVEIGYHFRKGGTPFPLALVATAGEEGLGNLSGMLAVTRRYGAQARAYIVLEGMALGHVYHRGLPIRRYRITVHGSGGHPWIHPGRPSAIHALLQVGDRIRRLRLPSSHRASLNIGQLVGGQTINTIASDAWLEVELRSESRAVLQRLSSRVEAEAYGHRQAGLEVSIELIGERPEGEIAEDHPLVCAAVGALEQAGVSPIRLSCGSTDASAPLSQGLPAVCLGLTYGGEAHSLGEYIELDPIPAGMKALMGLLHELLAEG
jgi:tripeptide aminopeptidase